MSKGFSWTCSPDPERPGRAIWTASPPNLPGWGFIVQQGSAGDEWDWVLLNADRLPVQIRTNYKLLASALLGAEEWIAVNPHG